MNWIEAIKKIREAQESNRLIIFVDAGVSKKQVCLLGDNWWIPLHKNRL